MNRIPLGERLGTLSEMGVSDLTVYPSILRGWGDAPASVFFLERNHWERMLHILGRTADEDTDLTYRQLAQEIYRLSEAPAPAGDSKFAFLESMMLLKDVFSLLNPSKTTKVTIHGNPNGTPLAKRLKSSGLHPIPTVLTLRTFALAQAVDKADPGKQMALSDIVYDHITSRFVEEAEKDITVQDALRMADEQELPETVLIYFYLLLYPFTIF